MVSWSKVSRKKMKLMVLVCNVTVSGFFAVIKIIGVIKIGDRFG